VDDPRRRYYRLKALGRGVLSAEVARLQGVLREARTHLRELKTLTASRSHREGRA